MKYSLIILISAMTLLFTNNYAMQPLMNRNTSYVSRFMQIFDKKKPLLYSLIQEIKEHQRNTEVLNDAMFELFKLEEGYPYPQRENIKNLLEKIITIIKNVAERNGNKTDDGTCDAANSLIQQLEALWSDVDQQS